jgi:hypothetical protein
MHTATENAYTMRSAFVGLVLAVFSLIPGPVALEAGGSVNATTQDSELWC